MSDLNNLTLLNCLREKGVAVVRTPAGVVAYGLSRVNVSDRGIFSRMTQTELLAAWRMSKCQMVS